MFQWYLSISWVSSSSFPANLRVLTFQVPIEMFSLPLIFLTFVPPVAYLSPMPQLLAVGAVIVKPGCDQSGIKVSLGLLSMMIQGQNSAWRIQSLSRLFMLTTAEFHDNNMAPLGHENMAIASKSSALAFDFF